MVPTTRDRNRQRLDSALELLGRALLPFFKREMERAYGTRWPEVVRGVLQRRGPAVDSDGVPDLSNLLYVIDDNRVWHEAFKGPLNAARYLVEELRQVRNRDAHIHPYANDITYRDLDTITRVLDLINAPEALQVSTRRQDVLLDLCQATREQMANKKAEVLAFLTESVFTPVLASQHTPPDVRRRVVATMETVNAMDTAREIVAFYWNAIMKSTDLPARMKESGVPRFEEVVEEFRERFSDQWLAGD